MTKLTIVKKKIEVWLMILLSLAAISIVEIVVLLLAYFCVVLPKSMWGVLIFIPASYYWMVLTNKLIHAMLGVFIARLKGMKDAT